MSSRSTVVVVDIEGQIIYVFQHYILCCNRCKREYSTCPVVQSYQLPRSFKQINFRTTICCIYTATPSMPASAAVFDDDTPARCALGSARFFSFLRGRPAEGRSSHWQ
jgi:hypothetical protein